MRFLLKALQNKKINNHEGFTLIELMIVIFILSTLTVITAQSIQQAVKSKVKLQGQIDDVSRMRDGVKLIERDINLAYHYNDLEMQVIESVYKTEQEMQKYLQSREAPRQSPETHFVGEADRLDFVTTNNANMVRNTKQADFIEVGYSLRDCRSLQEGQGSSKCIWRRQASIVDSDVTKGGKEQVLLENVTEFKLRYIGKGKQDWVSSWRTDAQGDGNTKGQFPQAVELSVTVEKKDKTRNKKYSMQLIIPIHFPNNIEKTTNETPTNNQQ